MDWFTDYWLDVLGWGGSVLLVFSLLQPRLFRLRLLNLMACVILTIFNAVLGIWPMVAMNVALSAINLWYLVQMLRERHDAAAFTVLPVRTNDAYLWHVLTVHAADIRRFNPHFDPMTWQSGSADVQGDSAGGDGGAWLILHGDETVGVVLVTPDGDTARVALDWVTPRYRDFAPGEFVWREHGLLQGHGFRRVVTPPGMVGAYYDRLGFRRDGEAWVLDLS